MRWPLRERTTRHEASPDVTLTWNGTGGLTVWCRGQKAPQHPIHLALGESIDVYEASGRGFGTIYYRTTPPPPAPYPTIDGCIRRLRLALRLLLSGRID